MSIVACSLFSQLSLCAFPPSSTSLLIARVRFVQSTTLQPLICFELCRAMDKNDREKEQASSLLSALYADVIAPDQMAKGFTKLLESVEDLSIDIPDAVELLSLFLARAVVDDILPPAYLARTGEAKLLTKKYPISVVGFVVMRTKIEDVQDVYEHVLKAEYCWCNTLLSYWCILVCPFCNSLSSHLQDCRKVILEWISSSCPTTPQHITPAVFATLFCA
jgi:hypothetical protein